MNDTVWIQNLTWEDIRDRRHDSQGTVIVPVGSTEQHGPHLPVGTDTMVAVALAEAGAVKTGALVAEILHGRGRIKTAPQCDSSPCRQGGA